MLDVPKKNCHKTGLTGKDNFVQNYCESGIKKSCRSTILIWGQESFFSTILLEEPRETLCSAPRQGVRKKQQVCFNRGERLNSTVLKEVVAGLLDFIVSKLSRLLVFKTIWEPGNGRLEQVKLKQQKLTVLTKLLPLFLNKQFSNFASFWLISEKVDFDNSCHCCFMKKCFFFLRFLLCHSGNSSPKAIFFKALV